MNSAVDESSDSSNLEVTETRDNIPDGIMFLIEYKDTAGLVNFVNDRAFSGFNEDIKEEILKELSP